MARLHFLDSNKVHTNRIFAQFIFHTIPSNCEQKATFLCFCEGFYGTSMTVSCSVFDLKKDGNSVFFCDNIYLSSFRCYEIRLDNIV